MDTLANNDNIILFFMLDMSSLRLKVWSNLSFNQFMCRISKRDFFAAGGNR